MEQPQQQIQGYRPVLAEQAAEMMSVDQCQSIGDLDDSQLVGAPDVKGGGGEAEVKEAKSSDNSLGKRRRGRPPGPHARVKTTPLRKKNEEEDVCFICFDGGSLVLCDRRGCPKAYHPACIKRDEAFFKSKAKWNCGWHICSSCQKASHYMCYTCTYSLCKACIKDADYQSVRGNKGFCGTCMRTIMLIEDVPGNKEAAQVDFDDTSSWEYLFKVYWILLKGQLSLTVNDLIKAKNPWRGAAVMASTGGAVVGLYVGNKTNDSGSVKSCADLEATNTIGSNKKPKLGDGGMSFLQGTNWASKELLEFVAHMKNGDVSVLSQFEAQALLLEYIKKNNLRDPHRKCQIICDPRLRNLFGKECVGHFEMLKLLEYHFLTKEIFMTENVIGPGVANIVAGEMEIDVNYDDQIMMGAGSDKRRKARKRVEDRVHPNPDAYAAIDAHNINMIYLRRNLIENLIDDADKFHERVVGSVVRIRISNSDQKQDIYRLVQVIGTNKAAEGYKIGTRTTNMNIEILNLDKKEVVPIDQISDQEFSQDECNRLRQSIECGLIKRFTVGEIRDKAMALRAIRVKDELAAEALRVSHLRDRASEKGRRKELRNLVEKLQLLNSPEERQRRLREIPEVHSDPKMDPSYVPEDNVGEIDEQQDNTVQPSRSVSGRKGRYSFSPQREGDISKNIGNRAQKTQGQKALERNGWNSTTNQGNLTGLVQCGSNYELVVQSNILSDVASESSSVLYSIDNFEMEKIWHYQDPTGKIQGPFAMVQLCKWGTTGVFPPDHRIWRTNENQEDSILLTDALNGQYCKETFLPHENNASSQGSTVAVDERNNGCDGGWNKSMNATPIDGKRVEVSWNTKHNGQMNSGNAEVERRSASADVIDSGEKQTGIFLQGCDPVILENSLPSQPQECCSLTSPVLHVKPYEVLSHQEGEGTAENNSHQNNGSVDWRQTTQDQKIKEHSNENRSDSEGQSVQSSGQSCRHPCASSPSNGCDSTSNFAAKSLETSEQDKRVLDYPDFPGPTPKSSDGDLQGLASENNHSVSLNLPVQDGGHSWSDSNLVGSGEQLQKVADDWGGYSPTPAKPYIDEWDSSLVSASSPKPREMTSDYVPTQVSVSGQLTEPIPTHPTSDVSGWQAILAATGDFCTLTAYESVSDLLAEVEAMETLCGLATTTSIMNCGGEFTEGSKNDSVGSVEGFSTATEPGKGDALSSTCDIQLPSDAMVTDEPLGICQASVQDLQQKSGVHPSTSPDMQGDGKPSDNSANKLEANVSVDELEAGEIPITASSKVCWDMPSTDEPWKARLESAETSLAAVQGNVNVSWRGSGRGTCDLPDLPHRSLVHSSPSVELEVDRKPSGSSANQLEANVSVNQPKANVSDDQLEPGEIQVTAPFKNTRDMSGTDSPQKSSLDSTETSYKAVQGNANAGWGGDRGSASISWGRSDPGSANVGWRGGQGIIQATAAGGMWEGQARYGGDRPIAPRGRGCPNRDLGSGRGRFVGNRQGLYGNGNGGGSSRPPLRGQRVCKYYESGNCKKGALCSYLHPEF